MTLQYTKKVIRNFMHPKNMGEIKNADGIGLVGNPYCGDQMKVYIKIGKKKVKVKEQEFIKNIKFKTFGCMAAISTSSMITQLAKGKTLNEAKKITRNDVSISLGKLPPIKEHCSNLASDALHASIENYEKKKK